MLKTMTTGEVDAADELETPSSEQAQPTTKIERTKPIMTTYTTSCKPLPFYADGEAPLEELVDKFGSRLEALEPYEKLILLATIATNMAFHETNETDEDWGHLDTYREIPSTTVGAELEATLPSLDTLSSDNLLGLAEAVVAQLRYTREVA